MVSALVFQFVSGACFDSQPSDDSHARASVHITEQCQSMQIGVFWDEKKSYAHQLLMGIQMTKPV